MYLLLLLALLAAGGHYEEVAMHVRATANTGASAEDIKEALLHVAVYAGVPARNRREWARAALELVGLPPDEFAAIREQARALGFKLRFHADELSAVGGAELAAELILDDILDDTLEDGRGEFHPGRIEQRCAVQRAPEAVEGEVGAGRDEYAVGQAEALQLAGRIADGATGGAPSG